MSRLLVAACLAGWAMAGSASAMVHLPQNGTHVVTLTANHTKLHKLTELARYAEEVKAVLREAAAQNADAIAVKLNRTKVELAEEREEWATEHDAAPGDLPLSKLLKKGLGR